MTKKFTAEEARALGKTSRMAEKELENIYALIKTFAEAGESRLWYKLPPHKEVAKAVREELMGAGYHVGYGPSGGCYMMRISWA